MKRMQWEIQMIRSFSYHEPHRYPTTCFCMQHRPAGCIPLSVWQQSGYTYCESTAYHRHNIDPGRSHKDNIPAIDRLTLHHTLPSQLENEPCVSARRTIG